jgi:hypothetical protein
MQGRPATPERESTAARMAGPLEAAVRTAGPAVVEEVAAVRTEGPAVVEEEAAAVRTAGPAVEEEAAAAIRTAGWGRVWDPWR